MIGEAFYWGLNMSISASFAGVAVLLIRGWKRIPRRVLPFLWCIPLLRMWIPFGIGGNYGLAALIAHFSATSVPVFETGTEAFSMMNYTMLAVEYYPIVYRYRALKTVFGVATIVWIAVAIGLLTLLFLRYRSGLRLARGAVRDGDDLFWSEALSVPSVLGVFLPKILLPLSFRDRDLRFVLLHEKTHIRRKDNLWRMLAFVTACVHWFNPLVWVFLHCFLTDLELACDESVLRGFDDEQKKAYATALLLSARSRNGLVSTFGGGKLRRRIENILSFNSLSIVSVVCLSVFVAVVAYIFLTNAP